MLWLLGNYAVICLAFLWEQDFRMALYWASAFGITSAVYWGLP